MSGRSIALCSLLACGLLLALPSQAGILWTFMNTNDIDLFGTEATWPGGASHAAMSWDAEGKLVATGDGVGNPIEFGKLLTYPGSSFATAKFSMHPLLTWRMQVAAGPATDNHGIVIIFTDDGKYLGKDFRYDSGDMVIQQDFSDTAGRFGEADLSTANISGIRFYLSYDVAAAQVCKFDWITLGDAAMLANTQPVYLQEFGDESGVTTFTDITQVQLDLSWAEGGYMHQLVASPYTDPELYFPLGAVSGSANPYVFMKMNVTNPPGGVDNKGCILGWFVGTELGTFVAKNFNFHPGTNIIVNDPSVQGVNINVPGVEVGTPLWRNYDVNPIRIDVGDDPDQATVYQDMSVDYDYLAIGGSVLWMLEKEYTFADTDSDGLSDTKETGIGTDVNDPDTDDDGLLDGQEVDDYGTDPFVTDTDGDTYSDKAEVDAGSDPLNADDYPGLELPAAGLVMLGLLIMVCMGLSVKMLRKA